MGNTRPWHSIAETDPKVYHDDTRCADGRSIQQQFRRDGTDGRRKCEQCQRYP